MKILITGGGTEEPIDSVRSICTISTGRTASFLAEYFLGRGHDVTALMAHRAVVPSASSDYGGTLTLLRYKTFAELRAALVTECRSGGYNAVVHAAAVSDYSPATVEIDDKTFAPGEILKLPSDGDLTIRMKRNPKLLGSLREWTGGTATIVAFKLTSGAAWQEQEEAVGKLFRTSAPNAVVSNDLSEISGDAHPSTLHHADGRTTHCATLEELAAALESLLVTMADTRRKR